MASKFQNRMAGTIILVALGVILLPGLLDGKKQHYKDEFAAIPLVPKPGDPLDNERVPAVTQSLPAKAIQQQAASQIPPDAGIVVNGHRSGLNGAASPPIQQEAQVRQEAVQQKQQALQLQARAEAEHEAKAAAEKAWQQSQPRTAQQTPPAESPANRHFVGGQAYVIQLAALSNAARVTEVLAKLRSAGFRAYSVPATAVQGQINRIFVGPDTSKSRLQTQIAPLEEKFKLKGLVVIPYRVN